MVKNKKWLANGLFLLLVLGLTFWFTFRGQDMTRVWTCVRSASPIWCVAAVVLVVAFILGESVIISGLMRSVGQKTRLPHCFLYSFVGFFFSCITPSASGGQPMQVWLMRRDGISAAVSVPVLILVAILYKLVLVVIGLLTMLVRPAVLMPYLEPAIGWCWLGVGLNVAAVTLMLLVVFRPALMRRLVGGLIRLGTRLFRLRRPERLLARAEAWIAQYADVATCFRRDGRAMLVATALTFVQRLLLFAVTVCCCLALGVGSGHLLTVLMLQAMIAVAADMMPLPGGSGISEMLFMRMFTPLLGEGTALPVMILSRGIGFYAQMFIGAAFSAVAFIVIRRQPTADAKI